MKNEVETRETGAQPGNQPQTGTPGSGASPSAAPQESELVTRLKTMTLEDAVGFLDSIRSGTPEKDEFEKLTPEMLNAIADAQETNTKTKRTVGTAAPSPSPAPQGTPPAEGDKEETVTLALKRSELGNYAPTGRSTADALKEMIRGWREKDNTISFFKEKKVPNLESALEKAETNYQKLLKELEELKAAKTAAPAAQPPAPAEEINLPDDIPEVNEDDVDAFDKDQMEKLTKRSKALRDVLKVNKNLKEQVDALKKPSTAPATPQGQAAQPAGTKEEPPTQESRKVEEIFMEIGEGQADPDMGKFIHTKRPFKEINQDYILFCTELADLAGIKQPFKQDGSMVEDTGLLVAAYLDPRDPEGEKIRSAVNQMNEKRVADKKPPISLPEEYPAYSTILNIREKQFVKRGGKIIDIGFLNAAKIYKAENPQMFVEADPAAKKAAEQQAIDAATAARKNKAIEVPTAQGAELTNPDYVESTALKIMAAKPFAEMTPDEVEIVKLGLKNAGASEAEITARFKTT